MNPRLVIVLLAAAAHPALAQQEVPAPAAPPAAPAGAAGSSPAAQFLADQYGISLAEATERAQLQDAIAELVAQVKRDNDSELGSIWVEHTPVFRINISYVTPDDRKLVKYRIDPKIRRYVKLVKAKKSRAEAEAGATEIFKTIEGSGIRDFAGYVEEDSGDVVLELPSNDMKQRVLNLIGSKRQNIRVVVKPIAKPTAGPIGVVSGDYIEGGHYFWQQRASDEASKGCTVAFQATYQGRLGILTAGHCNPGPEGTGYWHAVNGHWVEIPAPAIARWAYGTKYDFQWHDITGYSRSNAIYYFNQASVVGLPKSGWVRVNGTVGYYGQTKGMVSCKSGRVTGITCGAITSGNYYYNGANGWIRVFRASGQHLGRTGDSGSAVFSDAAQSTQVKAYGILTAAQAFSDGSSEMVYSPIDYIDPWGISLLTQ